MRRITVEVSDDTFGYLAGQKDLRGSSVSFEANQLIESAIKERIRKRKISPNGSPTTTEER